MRIQIPDHIRSGVIDVWMRGKSRDKIALEVNITFFILLDSRTVPGAFPSDLEAGILIKINVIL